MKCPLSVVSPLPLLAIFIGSGATAVGRMFWMNAICTYDRRAVGYLVSYPSRPLNLQKFQRRKLDTLMEFTHPLTNVKQ